MGMIASLGAKLTADSRDLDRGLSRAEDKLKKTKGEIDNTTGSTKKMNRASSQASAVLFSFSQGAQDAAFSVAGATNNIEPMVMQFGKLKTTTGSSTGAIKALGKQLLTVGGATGIAVTVATYIVNNWDKVKGIFTDTKEEAKELTDEVKNLKQSAQDLIRVAGEDNQLIARLDPNEIVPALTESQSRLDSLRARRQAVEDELDELIGLTGGIIPDQDYGVVSEERRQYVEQLRQEQATLQRNIEASRGLTEALREEAAAMAERNRIHNEVRQNPYANLESESPTNSTQPSFSGESVDTTEQGKPAGLANSAENAQELTGNLQGVAFAQQRVIKAERNRNRENEKLSMRLEQQSAKWRTATAYGMTFANSLSSGIGNAVNTMLKFENGIGSIAQAFVGFGKAAVGALKDVIVQMTTAIAKAAVLKGIMSIFNLGSIGGVSNGSFGDVFSSVLGFAEGGIVTGPTLGLIGEAGESEAVIPLSKLDSMMRNVAGGMGGSQLVSRIDMDELVIAIERHREFQTT